MKVGLQTCGEKKASPILFRQSLARRRGLLRLQRTNPLRFAIQWRSYDSALMLIIYFLQKRGSLCENGTVKPWRTNSSSFQHHSPGYVSKHQHISRHLRKYQCRNNIHVPRLVPLYAKESDAQTANGRHGGCRVCCQLYSSSGTQHFVKGFSSTFTWHVYVSFYCLTTSIMVHLTGI